MGTYTILAVTQKDKQENKPTSLRSPSDSEASASSNKQIDSSITQPVSQSAKQSTSQSTDRLDNQIMERPKAFYISQRVDRRLDEAVRYFQEVHGIRKADRSTLVNAILDDEAHWTEESLDHIVDRIISQLTSRLTG